MPTFERVNQRTHPLSDCVSWDLILFNLIQFNLIKPTHPLSDSVSWDLINLIQSNLIWFNIKDNKSKSYCRPAEMDICVLGCASLILSDHHNRKLDNNVCYILFLFYEKIKITNCYYSKILTKYHIFMSSYIHSYDTK